MPALTIYRIRDGLLADPPDGYDAVIDEDNLPTCERHDYGDATLTARLYLPPSPPQPPGWTQFVSDGFPAAAVGTRNSRSALIVAAVSWRNGVRAFAICFGHSRHMLRTDFIEPGFGRRVALNVVYEHPAEGQAPDFSRVRQVDARTIEANVRRARVQRSRDAAFDAFGVDPQRDLLDRIVGVPLNSTDYGKRVSGGDSIHLNIAVGFAELGALLRRLLSAASRKTYRDHFAWIDSVRPVVDAAIVEKLRERTIELIQTDPDDLDLAPPEIVDWDRVQSFTYEIGPKPEREDLRLEFYLDAVARSRVQELDYARFAAHRITARDGDGTVVARWSAFRSLFGEIELDGRRYVLDSGHFFAVAQSYIDAIDKFIDGVPTPAIELPSTTAGTVEEEYNSTVVGADATRLLLDRKTIQPASRTTPLEICDVLTSGGELVHVKRKLGSSNLSHLFGQGLVSAELIQSGPPGRAIVREKIAQEAASQQRNPNAFTAMVGEPFAAPGLTVVYAILANWLGRSPRERLPFFSKVNLRHHVEAMHRMGFKVALAPVSAA